MGEKRLANTKGGNRTRERTHNTTLQVVARAAQKDLLLLDLLLGRHIFVALAVVTGGNIDDRAIKHWLFEKCRASCEGSKEG